MEKLSEIEDPRRPSNRTRHAFREIVVCAMLSDADRFEDIALCGRLKADWLRRFLVLKNGIPSQDTFLRVLRVLDPKQFEAEAEAVALGMAAWREAQGTVGDTTAVFRDSAFENDVAKSNPAAILGQHGIKQVRSL